MSDEKTPHSAAYVIQDNDQCSKRTEHAFTIAKISTPNRMIAQAHIINEALNVLLAEPSLRRPWDDSFDDSFDNFIYLNITLPRDFEANSPECLIGKEDPHLDILGLRGRGSFGRCGSGVAVVVRLPAFRAGTFSRFFGPMFCHFFGVTLSYFFKEAFEDVTAGFAREIGACSTTGRSNGPFLLTIR